MSEPRLEAIVVPCTEEKVWNVNPETGATAAKDAYTKSVFKVWRAYAEGSGCEWFILSTKYGLIRPHQLIESYDVPVSSAVASPAFRQKLTQQGKELQLARFERVVLLDWERFEPLVKAAIGEAQVPLIVQKVRY